MSATSRLWGRSGGSFQSAMELSRQFHQSDGAVGAGDHEAATVEFDVGGCRFEHMRRDLLAGRDHLVGGADDRVAADDHRLGTAVPPPAINSSLSPCSRRIRPNGMPSRIASTCANGDQ